MREIVIEKNEAGQRLDKFLAKYMNEATCDLKVRGRAAF